MHLGRSFCRLLLAAASATALVVPDAASSEVTVQTRDADKFDTRDPPGVLSQLYSRTLTAADAVVALLDPRGGKPGSIYVGDERARAGVIAYNNYGQIVMINNGKSSDWIFPRGGIDTRYDGTAADTPTFRNTAVREAYDEAGIRLVEKANNLHYLIKSDDDAEYWYAARISRLEDCWPELQDARKQRMTITRHLVSYDEAWSRLHSNRKHQVMMIKAMMEIRSDGIL